VSVRAYDVIVAGAGIIGVALALDLQRRGMRVLIVERGEPGREASYAGAGMLAAFEITYPVAFRKLARAAAEVFPDWVAQLEIESGVSIDFRRYGTIAFGSSEQRALSEEELRRLESGLEYTGEPASFVEEDCVDPRTLMAAALETARRRGIDLMHGSPVMEVLLQSGRAAGVRTALAPYAAGAVVNCCGAWADELNLPGAPTRPVKGHLLSLLPRNKNMLRHVVRSVALDLYLIPRTGGPIVVGSTAEEAGFDKTVDPDTVLWLHQKAANIIPALGEARIHESWTGLRPGTPDALPIIGATHIPGYFAATGHFRNGILLAPITAKIMSAILAGEETEFDLMPFSPLRFL
jgi:glycine oxidase